MSKEVDEPVNLMHPGERSVHPTVCCGGVGHLGTINEKRGEKEGKKREGNEGVRALRAPHVHTSDHRPRVAT